MIPWLLAIALLAAQAPANDPKAVTAGTITVGRQGARAMNAIEPPPPTITDVQKLTVLTAVQRVEIAQLRAQAAQRDLEMLLKSLQVPGFTLDLNTLSYVPVKETPTK